MALIAVIGAGSWGTALSCTLANIGHSVRLWAYEGEVAAGILNERENRIFLPGIKLSENIIPTTDFAAAIEGADYVVSVMPSHFCRSIYKQMLPLLRPEMLFVSATKGIESGSLMRMSEVILDTVGTRFAPRLAVLSGPSFAREVVRGDPVAIVVASRDRMLASMVQKDFSSATFRLYASDDVIGVELGGAVKNVIAIAAGVVEGLGLGCSPMAALITRGLAEMTRLSSACGGRSESLAGLAGMGDLILTCTGALSRNRQVGGELGRGRKLSDILKSMRMVAEGVKTTEAAVALAERYGIEMPITRQVHRILRGEIAPRNAVRELMERSLKFE